VTAVGVANMQVTGQLWQLVVVHAELPAHLAALKNYFLLAKGDFYHSFLAEVNHDAQHRLLSQFLGRDKSNAQHVQSADMIIEFDCSSPRVIPSSLHAQTSSNKLCQHCFFLLHINQL